ncbi:MAG: Helix-turn-helix domain protein [Syntrophus sp. PtaB.Bin001]|nr:MAG: Helix-turn-helix domain protein [Syntrophus sp. PtaB.Bin001]
MTPGERVRKIRESVGITQAKFGEPLGFKWYKIKDIEAGKINVSPEIAKKLSNAYSIRFEWILTGEGSMKTENVRSTTSEQSAHEDSSQPVIEGNYQSRFRVSDALTMCARVLESGTSYATTLYMNIHHFDRAISAEERINQVEQNQTEMEVRNQEIEARSQSIEQQMKSMMQEMAGLKEKIAMLEEQNANLQIQVTQPKEIIKYGTDPTGNMLDQNDGGAEIDDVPEGSWGF